MPKQEPKTMWAVIFHDAFMDRLPTERVVVHDNDEAWIVENTDTTGPRRLAILKNSSTKLFDTYEDAYTTQVETIKAEIQSRELSVKNLKEKLEALLKNNKRVGTKR